MPHRQPACRCGLFSRGDRHCHTAGGRTSRKLQMTDQLGAGGLHQDFGALMARQLLETVASFD